MMRSAALVTFAACMWLATGALAQFVPQVSASWQAHGSTPHGGFVGNNSYSDPVSISGNSGTVSDGNGYGSCVATFSAGYGSISADAAVQTNEVGAQGDPDAGSVTPSMVSQSNFNDFLRVTSATLPAGSTVMLKMDLHLFAVVAGASSNFSSATYDVSTVDPYYPAPGHYSNVLQAMSTQGISTSILYPARVGDLVAVSNGLLANAYAGTVNWIPASGSVSADSSFRVSTRTPGVTLVSLSGTSYPAAVFAPFTSDLDGDGHADLLWRNTDDGSVQAWLMNGLSVSQVAGLIPAGGWSVTHVADLDGDGHADLLLRHIDGTIEAWLMNGLTVTGTAMLAPAGSGVTILHVADLDGDGRADIVWQLDDGTVGAWLMNGLTASASATFAGAGSGWTVAQVADLDGDGMSDLIWQHADGSVQAWLMNGLSVKSNASYVPAGTGWSVALTGDFNGDGKADIFWQHADGSTQAWLMDGLAVTQLASFTPAGTGWYPRLVADLDADGKSDLFWEHSNGASQTWLMNGLMVADLASFVPAASGWTLEKVIDLNGDVKGDVLWKHTSGATQAWLMDGLSVTQVGSLTPPGSYVTVP